MTYPRPARRHLDPCHPRTRDRSPRHRRDAHRSLAVRGAPREDPPARDPAVRGRPRPREWIAGEAVDEGSRRRSGGGVHRGSRAYRRGRAADRVACRSTRRRDLLRGPQPAGRAPRPGREIPVAGRAGPASASGASSSACAGLQHLAACGRTATIGLDAGAVGRPQAQPSSDRPKAVGLPTPAPDSPLCMLPRMHEAPPIHRRGRSVGVGVVLILTLVIGAVVGGILDYRAWHANAALEAAIPVLLAIVIAIVAGTWWLVRRPRRAGLVAVAAVVFIIGFRIGAWVAPSANPPDWSPGTITLDLQDPALGLASGAASCSTHSDGSFSVGSDPAQLLAGTPVTYYLSGSGSVAQDQAYFELSTQPGSGAGPAGIRTWREIPRSTSGSTGRRLPVGPSSSTSPVAWIRPAKAAFLASCRKPSAAS